MFKSNYNQKQTCPTSLGKILAINGDNPNKGQGAGASPTLFIQKLLSLKNYYLKWKIKLNY